MTLRNFLKLHKGGDAYVSIHKETTYNREMDIYTETYYFEEACQEDILESDTFKEIASKQVDQFCVIGGGAYPVELCISLKEEV